MYGKVILWTQNNCLLTAQTKGKKNSVIPNWTIASYSPLKHALSHLDISHIQQWVHYSDTTDEALHCKDRFKSFPLCIQTLTYLNYTCTLAAHVSILHATNVEHQDKQLQLFSKHRKGRKLSSKNTYFP